MLAKRNSLTIGLFWILLVAVGVFWYIKDTRGLEKALQEEKKYKEILAQSQDEVKRLTQVETIHKEMEAKWKTAPKIIISADEPSFTLSYINWIMSANNLGIDFDFVLNQKKNIGDYTKFTYTLTGEGPYTDVYKLIWQLTFQPILYQINFINLRLGDQEAGTLKFNMGLDGYTVESESATAVDLNQFRPSQTYGFRLVNNVFDPLVRPRPVFVERPRPEQPKLPPKKPGEIDVEKATLKVVTSNSIFISEGKSGLVALKVGDPVYLGRLVSINQQRNEAEFLITKFGNSQRIVLTIDLSQ